LHQNVNDISPSLINDVKKMMQKYYNSLSLQKHILVQ